MRCVAVPTGGHTKHGRPEAMGLECDKMSVPAAECHWKNYTARIVERLRAKQLSLKGIIMDSHKAGPQNWTDDLPAEFEKRRGYAPRPLAVRSARWAIRFRSRSL